MHGAIARRDRQLERERARVRIGVQSWSTCREDAELHRPERYSSSTDRWFEKPPARLQDVLLIEPASGVCSSGLSDERIRASHVAHGLVASGALSRLLDADAEDEPF